MYAIFTDGTELSSTLPFTFVAKLVVYGPNIYIYMERGGWEVKREAVTMPYSILLQNSSLAFHTFMHSSCPAFLDLH